MLVDVLDPVTLQPSGEVKPHADAWRDGDLLGGINIWIVRDTAEGAALLFQRRSLQLDTGAGKLEVSVGGHYDVGETFREGLREAQEELGRAYSVDMLIPLGKRLVSFERYTPPRRYAIDVFFVRDNAPMSEFRLDPGEVAGLYECPLAALVALCSSEIEFCQVEGVCWHNGAVVADQLALSFDMLWWQPGDYYLQIAQAAQRLMHGERDLRLW